MSPTDAKIKLEVEEPRKRADEKDDTGLRAQRNKASGNWHPPQSNPNNGSHDAAHRIWMYE